MTDTRRQILIVDDEKPVVDLLSLTFEQEGHVVARAADGIDCMNRMAGFRPDVVIVHASGSMTVTSLAHKEAGVGIDRHVLWLRSFQRDRRLGDSTVRHKLVIA